MRILIIIVMFFVISALFIISNENLALYKQENVSEFSKLYTEWLNQIFSNSQKITGEVVKLNWLPEGVVGEGQGFPAR